MSFLNDYPQMQTVLDIAKRKKVGVYLVGGFLRDYVLKRSCLDFDFAVERDALPFARQFAKKIKGAFVLLDEERGCARVVKKKEETLLTFDFADFRGPTFQKDLQCRDFTINTFSVDMKTLHPKTRIEDVLLDLKKGMPDLKARRIRMASDRAFREDPLRLLRAFSLRAALRFKIEGKTLEQIKKDKDRIRDVSYERIRDELFKVFASDQAAVNLRAMDRIGLLEKVIPQISVMYQVKQGTYHHLDVWPHSLQTVAEFEMIAAEMKDNDDVRNYLQESLGGQRSRYALIKLAALLHDIGKPETRKREAGRISFHGHERLGRQIVKNVAKQLKISTKERHALEDMVLWHLRPGYLSNFKKPSDRAIFRYMRDTKEEAASIGLLSLADQRATRGSATTEHDQRHHEKICLNVVERYFVKKKEKPLIRLIDGHDLIRKCKLKPSPVFAKILSAVEEGQAAAKIKTKEEALALARKMAVKEKKV